MEADISDNTVLQRSLHCVVREQEGQYLIYNNVSDELHLISPTGFFLFQICDGSTTVANIEILLALQLGEEALSGNLKPPVHLFLNKLLERGILEVKRHE